MVDYSAHIQFDSGAAVVQSGAKTYRVAGCNVDSQNHACPTELIIGAIGS